MRPRVPIDPQQPLAAAPDGRPRRHGGHSTRGGRRAIAAPESRPSGVASPRAARGFPAAETGPPLPPNHPHATAPTKAPSARYRRAQSPTMTIYEPVPARVPLHLGVSRADSSRRLGTASPSWEPPPTAPQPVARHPGGGPPALFLSSPPRRWACGWSPERGARPLPPSDYSGCGRGHHCFAGLLRARRLAGGLNCFLAESADQRMRAVSGLPLY